MLIPVSDRLLHSGVLLTDIVFAFNNHDPGWGDGVATGCWALGW